MKNSFLQRLFNYIALGFVVLLLASTYKNIKKLFEIRQAVKKEEAIISKLQSENNRIEEEIKKAKSPEFIEKQVRDKLGLVKEGEVVVILPEIEEVKKLAPKIEVEEEYLPDPNWRKWMKLFL